MSSVSTRILFISVLTKVVVLMPLYTGAVASFLTISNAYFPFNDVKGFVNDGRYQIVTQPKTFQANFFEAYYRVRCFKPRLLKNLALNHVLN